MSEMLERVARAICKSIDGRDPDDLIAVYEGRPQTKGGIMLPTYKSDWENYLKQARAALTEMREAPDDILLKCICWSGAHNGKEPEDFQMAWMRQGWRSAIDEALK
jgi:hypothetical protein